MIIEHAISIALIVALLAIDFWIETRRPWTPIDRTFSYRSPMLPPSATIDPRSGWRSWWYFGSSLALRAPEAPWWRLLWNWRSVMRLRDRARWEWRTVMRYAPVPRGFIQVPRWRTARERVRH